MDAQLVCLAVYKVSGQSFHLLQSYYKKKLSDRLIFQNVRIFLATTVVRQLESRQKKISNSQLAAVFNKAWYTV